MLFPVRLSHVSRACTALSKHGVGVEPLFWPDFWDRGRACARGGGLHDMLTALCIWPMKVAFLLWLPTSTRMSFMQILYTGEAYCKGVTKWN